MGKSGFMTPKAIANRWKAKGLQKLRWYCQMCNKQCRDENGFKCHCTSESHLRQMAIFNRNGGKIIEDFSGQFERTFMSHLSRRFGTKRVSANIVYNEYIQDKEHLHMNATRWTTLTSFVKYLGQEGKAVVDETEKGWYIQYIDRDPRALARQAALLKMKRHERSEEDRHRRHIQKLVEAAKTSGDTGPEFTGLKREEGEAKVKVAFTKKRVGGSEPAASRKRPRPADAFSAAAATGGGSGSGSGPASGAGAGAGSGGGARGSGARSGRGSGRRRSAMEEIMEENERQKAAAAAREAAAEAAAAQSAMMREAAEAKPKPAKRARKSYWLTPGIIVKCKNKEVMDGKYYKQKALVRKVKGKHAAIIVMLKDGVKLRIDQDELETVIPRPGGTVKVVNGEHRGETGTVVSIQVDDFCTRVKLTSGPRRGEEVSIEYEDVCKLDVESAAKATKRKA